MNKLYLPVFENEKGVTAFFSTKAGASFKSPYYNKTVLEELSLDNCELIWPEQVHQASVSVIRDDIRNTEVNRVIRDDGCNIEGIRVLKTDGIITNVPNVLLTTVHADCLAVYFYDRKQNAIGVVHAGWRGTVEGIAVNAVRSMEREYGSRPEDIISFISPGISKCCFETGTEVYEAFNKKWNWIDEFTEKKGEKYYIDLKAINKRQLLDVGLKNIQVSIHCTCCDPQLFCSYRGEKGTTMRMGAGICLKK